MNQGGNTQAVAPSPLDPNSIEKRYGVDGSQVQISSYQYSTGSEGASWTAHRVENQAVENVNYPNSNYYHPQPTGPATGNVQEVQNTASFTSSSTFGTANVAQDYSGYTPYQTSSEPHNYSNTGYSNYYSGYQQQPSQPSQSYTQPVAAYQNTGAPYQPLSSFQNPGSYAGTPSYSGTYYNPADYQTTGGYQSTNYNNQTAGGYPSTNYSNQTPTSNQGTYTDYTSNPYQNYTPDAANTSSSTIATTTPVHYQQNYQQWPGYYSQTEVPCAPGTEKLPATSTFSQSFPVPAVTNEMPASNGQPAPSYASNGQPAPSYAQPWRQETNSSQPPSQQPGAAVSASNDSYWMHQTPNQQAHYPVPPQNHYQSPLETKPLYETPFQGHQRATYPQELKSQSSIHQASLGYRQPTQTTLPVDTQRVSKVQIPTNPRIASNLPSGYTKMEKDSPAPGATQTPAYVSVSIPKGHTTATPEPETMPKSLRGFVERAFARCKDDKEKASCQAALREIITKARDDRTLHTRDWDTEPLSTVLNADVTNTESSSTLNSSLQNKSPTRRPKSRWEPLQEAKPFVKSASTFSSGVKFGGWNHQNENNKKISENFQKVDSTTNSKPTYSWQNSAKKSFQRPVKRQRFSGGVATAIDDEASSDSDKDLTPYYSSAMALASSTEEKKRRDSRSKRFEKVQGHSRGNDIPKPKNANVGNLHSRRATALRLSRDLDESGSRAVEDIDWDALTVKGTCQEIEKRYLRLTSAPDPSTVRPEDVLEKALLMVQDSQKNYLYKCDQLKSIRQDLTVQRIHNHLTAKVYETHARLALEAGDLPEYNQCLSQLKILYSEGIEGCSLEFAAYSLLYITLHSNNNRELLSSMSRLTEEAKKDEAVRHALSVRAAVTSGNYVMFFRLYKTAPNMNSCLMDLYVEKMRYKAVNFMARSCRPTIPVSHIVQVLGFGASAEGSGEKESDGMEECSEWLKAHGASLISDGNGDLLLDTKASANSLFMPEPEDAVSHGDRYLDVNDFFTRTV
uniref:Leukocyte receptor cluster member 8 n=1 Tax=Noccaea caerulescens TaxID=107243 RepID=A0A1J3F012_NOCCA